MTPEERFERIDRTLDRLGERTAEHDRLIAERERIGARTDARLDRMGERVGEHERLIAERERIGARTDARLDRAILLAVREARAERERRKKANAEFDEKFTQLAAAQLITEQGLRELRETQQVTEQKFQALLDSLRRGGNGHP